MKYSLLTVRSINADGTVNGYWLQNKIGTLEYATEAAIATEKVNSNSITVAVVEEITGGCTLSAQRENLKRLDRIPAWLWSNPHTMSSMNKPLTPQTIDLGRNNNCNIISVEDAYDDAMVENLEDWQIFLGCVNRQNWIQAQKEWDRHTDVYKTIIRGHIARLTTKHIPIMDRCNAKIMGFALWSNKTPGSCLGFSIES